MVVHDSDAASVNFALLDSWNRSLSRGCAGRRMRRAQCRAPSARRRDRRRRGCRSQQVFRGSARSWACHHSLWILMVRRFLSYSLLQLSHMICPPIVYAYKQTDRTSQRRRGPMGQAFLSPRLPRHAQPRGFRHKECVNVHNPETLELVSR